MSGRPSRRLRATQIALAALSPLVLLVIAEVAARMLDLQTGFFVRPNAAMCLRRSALYEYEPMPNCVGELSATSVRTNAQGLRGPALRQDGSIRILALGDSCTWGWRVSEADAYPTVLQRLLDERYGTGTYQVLNAGVPGTTSHRGLVYLREEGLALKPAIVIASYGFNDASPGGDDEERLAANRRLLPLLRAEDVLIAYSRFYRWVRWQIAPDGRREGPRRVAPEKFERNLTQMVQLTRAAGVHLMLVSFLEFRVHTGYRVALENVAERFDVPLLFYQGQRLDVVHPVREGYRTIAREILDVLIAEGWVPPPRAS